MTSVPLGDVIVPAKVRRAGDGDFPLLSMTMHDGLVDQSTKFKKRVASNDVSTYKVIRRGQLVVGFPIDEGVLDFQELYDAGIVSPAYGVWDLRSPETISRAYLKKYLRSPAAMAYYKAKLRGSTARRRSLPAEVFLALPVPIPPLNEQRRIATVLDQADAIRTKRRQVLTHLDTLTQSIFQDMFGTVPIGPTLDEVGADFRYGTSNKAGDAGFPALRIPNVVGGALNLNEIKTVQVEPAELERLRLRRGDLLFVRSNGNPDNVGRSAIFEPSVVSSLAYDSGAWIYASYLIRARLRGISPKFVAAYLTTPAGRRQLRARAKTSAGQYNINTEGLGSLRVPNVDGYAQDEFAQRIAAVEPRRELVSSAVLADDELFASLQSRAFRGDL